MDNNSKWENTQKKLYAMVSTGVTDSTLNQFYDIISTLALVANLICDSHSLGHLAECRILAVKMRRCCCHDKEL